MAVKFPQNHTWRQASFPSRSPKPTQATGWGLAVNVSGCAWASGSSSGGGSWWGGVRAASWPRPQALTASGRCPCHPGRVPITSQCPLAQPTPRSAHLQPLGVHGHQLPGACAPLPAAGSGAQTLLPGPSNLKGRGGRCGGRGRLSIGCRREGAGPGRRTAREGPRSRLGGNPEGGPRRRLRLDAAGR